MPLGDLARVSENASSLDYKVKIDTKQTDIKGAPKRGDLQIEATFCGEWGRGDQAGTRPTVPLTYCVASDRF